MTLHKLYNVFSGPEAGDPVKKYVQYKPKTVDIAMFLNAIYLLNEV